MKSPQPFRLAGPGLMAIDGVADRVRRIFSEKLQIDVGPETDILRAGVLDSMAFVQLIVELEDEFDLSVDVATMALDDFRSPAAIERFVRGRLAKAS